MTGRETFSLPMICICNCGELQQTIDGPSDGRTSELLNLSRETRHDAYGAMTSPVFNLKRSVSTSTSTRMNHLLSRSLYDVTGRIALVTGGGTGM